MIDLSSRERVHTNICRGYSEAVKPFVPSSPSKHGPGIYGTVGAPALTDMSRPLHHGMHIDAIDVPIVLFHSWETFSLTHNRNSCDESSPRFIPGICPGSRG